MDRKIISLQSELAAISRETGEDKRMLREIQETARKFRENPNLDPAEVLAEKWKRDKCGREWTRDRVANLVKHAVKIRKEHDALNTEAWELFLSVITAGETPKWFEDWK